MSNQKAAKQSLLLPLIGLTLGWLSFIAAVWADLYVPFPRYDNNGNTIDEPQVQLSTYLFLIGLAPLRHLRAFGSAKSIGRPSP